MERSVLGNSKARRARLSVASDTVIAYLFTLFGLRESEGGEGAPVCPSPRLTREQSARRCLHLARGVPTPTEWREQTGV